MAKSSNGDVALKRYDTVRRKARRGGLEQGQARGIASAEDTTRHILSYLNKIIAKHGLEETMNRLQEIAEEE